MKTCYPDMEFHKRNLANYSLLKTVDVKSAVIILRVTYLAWTIAIRLVKSEEYCVSLATPY
jgi:hypothetical protein